jgi:Tfp pilus assembly protein PilF
MSSALRGGFSKAWEEAVRHHREGRINESLIYYKRALVFKPGHADAHRNLGAALQSLGRTEEAAAHYERAIALKPTLAGAHNNLGILRMAEGRFDDARTHYQRAVALDPNHAEAHNNLGVFFKEEGRFDQAMAHFAQAIAIRPDYAEAHYNRAEIWNFIHGDEHLQALEALTARKNAPSGSALYLHFALAKALEDSGDFSRAFVHLRQGNALKRAQIGYDEATERLQMKRISKVFDREILRRLQGQGDPSNCPIFIVGMPRSGTTLVEQILASHPRIQAGGELRAMEAAAGPNYPRLVPDLDEAALQRIGRFYLAGLPPLAEGKTHIVDKLPGNFLKIGLIHLMLPNARIIHVTRHAVDTCMSCYSKLFETGHHYCYDLAELGRYYRAYDDLMTHWRTVLPPDSFLEVSYEEVVEHLEIQARRMIEYCGLAWDDRCISFHRTERAVRTASAVQVRKPLFRTSLQRWRRHAADLTPLLSELGDTWKGDTQFRVVGT